ncbi:hypothetical protein BC835DRAFT_1411560 [Cytidiella melzeri]|nr:hypothetical protein BC835DRAFT_1411560 [Cytidiella melzeri]
MVEVLLHSRSGHGEATTTEETKMDHLDQMVDQLDSLQRLVRLRFISKSRDDLVQFVEASRAVLAKLNDRIDLIYKAGPFRGRIVDCITLEAVWKIIHLYESPELPDTHFHNAWSKFLGVLEQKSSVTDMAVYVPKAEDATEVHLNLVTHASPVSAFPMILSPLQAFLPPHNTRGHVSFRLLQKPVLRARPTSVRPTDRFRLCLMSISAPQYDYILIPHCTSKLAEGVALTTLSRPNALNALKHPSTIL